MKLFNIQNIQFRNILGAFTSYIESIGGKMNRTSVFGQLITSISGIIHNTMLYIEDALTEQNKYTAQRKKSIYALASQSGYKPSYGRSAGCWVRVSHIPHNETTGNVIIKDHERLVCSTNGMYYTAILGGGTKVIPQTGQLVDDHIYLTQGHFERQRIVVGGGNNYVVNFKYLGYIDIQYVRVSVNGITWNVEESLYDMTPNSNSYYIRYNYTEGVDICFGNGTHGKVLYDGDVVEIEYLSHDGESGNIIPNDQTLFVFADPLMDMNGDEVDGNIMFKVTLVDQHSVTSGSNTEDIETVREMIGYNSRSLVLADPLNFKHYLSQFSFIGYSRTWSEPGSLHIKSMVMKDFRKMMNEKQDYFMLSEKDFYLSAHQKESVKNSLIQSGSLMAGSSYEIVDMSLVKYALYVYIKLKPGAVSVNNEVMDRVATLFTDIKSDRYIPKSDVIREIQKIPGVDGVDVSFLSEKNERAKRNKQYKVGNFVYKVVGDPGLGFDDYGNILTSEEEFPVLMGGWNMYDTENIYTVEPISIYYV